MPLVWLLPWARPPGSLTWVMPTAPFLASLLLPLSSCLQSILHPGLRVILLKHKYHPSTAHHSLPPVAPTGLRGKAQVLQEARLPLTHHLPPPPVAAPLTTASTLPPELAKHILTPGRLHLLFPWPELLYHRSSQDLFKPLLKCALNRKAIPDHLSSNVLPHPSLSTFLPTFPSPLYSVLLLSMGPNIVCICWLYIAFLTPAGM